MVIRYARASTSGQNIDDQTGALKQVDVAHIFAETAGGASAKRWVSALRGYLSAASGS